MPKIFAIAHEEPNAFRFDYILLPYGEFYDKTAEILKARSGDVIRFYNGRDAEIHGVRLVEDPILCNMLCRMRYGIPWQSAFSRWLKYARFEGHGKDILLSDKCIMVMYRIPCQENDQ